MLRAQAADAHTRNAELAGHISLQLRVIESDRLESPSSVPRTRRLHWRDIPSEARIHPRLDALAIPFPETLQHTHDLLPMTLSTPDVVMEERAMDHPDSSTHLMKCSGGDEHRGRQLARSPARRNRQVHREDRSHWWRVSDRGSTKLRHWRSRNHFPRVVTFSCIQCSIATLPGNGAPATPREIEHARLTTTRPGALMRAPGRITTAVWSYRDRIIEWWFQPLCPSRFVAIPYRRPHC